MSTNYINLRRDNERRYGTDIGRIGGMLLANRYDERTHFIFELLQNAEDALRRRDGWKGPRGVAFDLSDTELRISHFGEPFNEADVQGICGIDESTKDITSIGRFGIGFKSVYAFTDRPEIHSGDEAFGVENYVWPIAVKPRERHSDETIIVLPLKDTDTAGHEEIARCLEHLGAQALLFLRHVNEISWAVKGGASGLYLRGNAEPPGDNVRILSLIGEQKGKPDVEERWLAFSREVENGGRPVGHVEIAFSLAASEGGPWSIQPVAETPLVVFFPTVLATNTGFLIQGPYRTTPSRDNVPHHDPWNEHLVDQTSELLIAALKWLSVKERLDIGTLECLPLDRGKFKAGLFAKMFDKVVGALKSEELLPTLPSGYVAAKNARLSRTQDLRDLFEPQQLASVLGSSVPISWISGEVTADRTPKLRQYLLHELDVTEMTPESLLTRLNRPFLEAQPDEWIVKIYEFLSNVPAIMRHGRLDYVPLVRLESGNHVPGFVDDQAQAFLPGDTKTDFPTVRRSVCSQPESKKFLRALGLTEPNPVDDVIRNVLPKYSEGRHEIVGYATDIERILRAFGTDSKIQRDKLVTALKSTSFLMSVDSGDGSKHADVPADVYLAAGRLKDLFAGLKNIRIVDDSYDCLRGEDVREMLEACGASRYIYPVSIDPGFSWDYRLQLRREGGCESYSHEGIIQDYTLRGLNELLKQLRRLDVSERKKKAASLWDALIELQDRRGQGTFSGEYRWKYIHMRSASFDSYFIRRLNDVAWIPDAEGELQPPGLILFETLSWKPNAFLLSKIIFKKPIVDELAREAGFEPGVLDMLKKLGLTNTADLMLRLGVVEEEEAEEEGSTQALDDDDDIEDVGSNDADIDDEIEDNGVGGRDGRSVEPGTTATGRERSDAEPQGGRTGERGHNHRDDEGESRGVQKSGERRFVSYVAADPDEGGDDPDGLDQAGRMALEARAISIIRDCEPVLQIMPQGNEGFDLLEADMNGEPERWIEVKAMTGSLKDRPVGLSKVQFEFARRHGEQYWLYIVEHASGSRARIVKIQNPAGRVGTFTFDHGWIEVADLEEPLKRVS